MARTTTKKAVAAAKTTRARKTPQATAAQAISTSLASVARVVGVIFGQGGQIYSYHTRDETIAVGDYCIVISPSTQVHNGFFDSRLNGSPQVVRVVETKETVHSVNAASKFIVQKLDMDQVIAQAARREQIEVLQAKIKRARKEAEERIQLEQLRELSPELDSLISQLDTLVG